MKEKLRKLDGKPTEPGYYWYRARNGGWGGVLQVYKGHGDGGLVVVTGSGNVAPLTDYEGQWSERIPDCDWEGETQVVKPDSKDEVVQEDWEYLFDRWDIWGNHSVSNLVKDNYPAWVGEPCGECSTGWEYFRKPVDQGETRR